MKTITKINKNTKNLKFAFLILVFLFEYNSTLAQHRKYTEKDMPSAVITSFQKNFPGAGVRGYDKETEDGVTSYEVEATVNDIVKDIQFDEAGNVIEIEEAMNTADLPDKVVAAINEKYGNSPILKSEKVTKGTDILYEVVVKYKKKKHEVRLDKDGNIVKVE